LLAAVIVLGLEALFLLFVLLSSQRVASHSCETKRELLRHPIIGEKVIHIFLALQVTIATVQVDENTLNFSFN